MNARIADTQHGVRLPLVLLVGAGLLLLLAAAAFWPNYLSRPWASIDAYTHMHALLGTAWMGMLVAQPALVFAGRRRAHRALGRGALSVAPAFVVSGVLLAHFKLSRMAADLFAKEGVYVYLPLSVALLFAVAAGLGWFWRRSPAVHARFMASTALLLLDPVLARVLFFRLPRLPFDALYQGISFSLVALALFFLWRTLPAGVAGRAAFGNFCIGTVGVLVLFFVLPHTRAWAAFTLGFRGLPLT
jgi:uncharacterized membrane protein YozB (DUF420 family)